MKNIDTVGSSMSSGGITASGVSGELIVSPKSIFAGPVNQTMSPAPASSTSARSSPFVT